jgi:hypothetical protein
MRDSKSRPINCKAVTLATRSWVKTSKLHDMVLVLKRFKNEYHIMKLSRLVTLFFDFASTFSDFLVRHHTSELLALLHDGFLITTS